MYWSSHCFLPTPHLWTPFLPHFASSTPHQLGNSPYLPTRMPSSPRAGFVTLLVYCHTPPLHPLCQADRCLLCLAPANGSWGLSWWYRGKESACQCRTRSRRGFIPWVRKIPWRRKQQPIPVFVPGYPRGWTEEPGGLYSPWVHRVRHDWARTHRCLLLCNRFFKFSLKQ